jgi:hypothetical protein
MRFAESAAHLAGLTGLLLGWRPGEFWAATPAEVSIVLGAMGEQPEDVTVDDLKRLRECFPD